MVWLKWVLFFFSSRRRHTRFKCDWSSDVCSSDLQPPAGPSPQPVRVPERGTNWGRVIGIGLVVTAGGLVGATSVGGFYTPGAGAADDPASVAAARALPAPAPAMVRAAGITTGSGPAAGT